MQYGALSQSQVFRHFQGHLKTAGRFNNDADGFQASDVLAGISDAFIVIGKLTYTFGTTERHVQGILSNIHTDTQTSSFVISFFSFLTRPCVMRV